MKGMTFCEPYYGQGGSSPDPMFFYRLQGILGAGRKKTAAMPDKWADRGLVYPDETEKDSLHEMPLYIDSAFVSLPVFLDPMLRPA